MTQTGSCPFREVSHTPRAVAIGAFDGVHIGHAVVVRSVLAAAARLGVASAALTFEPTPRQFFGRDEQARLRLTPDPERIGLLCNLGIEQVIVRSFDDELRRLSPEEFVHQILLDRLDARFVAIGASHTFGAGRGAGPEEMVRFGEELGFEVEVVPLVSNDGLSVSSTKIRDALAAGRVDAAWTMLGRPYTLLGEVVRGHHRGTDLGWPTANIETPDDKLLPADGVYAGIARVGGPDEPTFAAAVSLGAAPSVGVHERRLEAHLIDFEGDLYGREVAIALLQRLRDIETFSDPNELAKKVARDVAACRRIYDEVVDGQLA